MKKKSLYKENFSHTHSVGGIVTQKPWANNISLAKLVKEKYGEVEEDQLDVKGLQNEISNSIEEDYNTEYMVKELILYQLSKKYKLSNSDFNFY